MGCILVADIGGTNCRLARFSLDDGSLALDRAVWISTKEVVDTQTLLAAMFRELDTIPAMADALVAAVAGPVAGHRGKLTNAALQVDLTDAPARQGIARALVINDFAAQAYACVTEIGRKARRITPRIPSKQRKNTGHCGVIGAGTGLGMALLVRDKRHGALTPVASEGGHAGFPFVGEEEHAFHEFVRRERGCDFARAEDILSGRGLVLLHRYLAGESLGAREVGKRALRSDTPTLRWFSRFYARACRNWILTTLCTEGLWIAGGIAAGDPLCVTSGYFLRELYASEQTLISEVPVYLIEDRNSGLWGAARAGLDLLEGSA
ncbi:MAG: glucokinase [Desulfovibrio sp.]|jgi:glucokinase|nr:glucokinase [Desulfovibrio sp.]